MPKPSKETLKKNRDNYTSQVKDIISYIKGRTKDNKDPFGFVVIPFYRTIEQAERNDFKRLCDGMISNIQDTSLMKTALCDALEAYAKSEKGDEDKQLKMFSKKERPSALAIELATAIGDECETFDRVLLMHLGEMKRRNKQGLIYTSMPQGITERLKKNNGSMDTGRCPIYIDYEQDDFSHVMAALIVGYCKSHGYDIENTANKVFGATMSADCKVSEYPQEEDD